MVRASSALEICVAASETEPPIPKMRTVSPFRSRALVTTIRQAVTQAALREAAWRKSSDGGFRITLPIGAQTYSANVPSTCSPKMRPRVQRTSSPLRSRLVHRRLLPGRRHRPLGHSRGELERARAAGPDDALPPDRDQRCPHHWPASTRDAEPDARARHAAPVHLRASASGGATISRLDPDGHRSASSTMRPERNPERHWRRLNRSGFGPNCK